MEEVKVWGRKLVDVLHVYGVEPVRSYTDNNEIGRASCRERV